MKLRHQLLGSLAFWAVVTGVGALIFQAFYALSKVWP